MAQPLLKVLIVTVVMGCTASGLYVWVGCMITCSLRRWLKPPGGCLWKVPTGDSLKAKTPTLRAGEY